MKKFIGFIICTVISLGLLILSLISDNISCSYESGLCKYTSSIRYLNIELDNETFPVTNLTKTDCEKRIQPSKKGKQTYYILKINTNTRPLNISSYKKYTECKNDANEIKNYALKHPNNNLNLDSGIGFLNTFGIMFAVIIFIVGIIILKDNGENEIETEDDDNEE